MFSSSKFDTFYIVLLNSFIKYILKNLFKKMEESVGKKTSLKNIRSLWCLDRLVMNACLFLNTVFCRNPWRRLVGGIVVQVKIINKTNLNAWLWNYLVIYVIWNTTVLECLNSHLKLNTLFYIYFDDQFVYFPSDSSEVNWHENVIDT